MTSRRLSVMAVLALVSTTLVAPSALRPSAAATTVAHPTTLIASITRDNKVATCGPVVKMTPDARYVVFFQRTQLFRRDLRSGTTQLVSATREGRPAQFSPDPNEFEISGNGRYVAYLSWANNIAPETGGNGFMRLFVRDMNSRNTFVVSLSPSGTVSETVDLPLRLDFTDDGSLLFATAAPDLTADSPNIGDSQVYLWDVTTHRNTLVSRSAAGVVGTGPSGPGGVSISADGRVIAFDSSAPDLLTGALTSGSHVYVRDLVTGQTRLVDRTPTGEISGGALGPVSLSSDGRFLAFSASPEVLGRSGRDELVLRDLRLGRTQQIRVPGLGLPVDGIGPQVSRDGRYVAFVGAWVQYGPADQPAAWYHPEQAWVRDMTTRAVRLVSTLPDGQPVGPFDFRAAVRNVALSDDGRFVALATSAPMATSDKAFSPDNVDDAVAYRVGPLH